VQKLLTKTGGLFRRCGKNNLRRLQTANLWLVAGRWSLVIRRWSLVTGDAYCVFGLASLVLSLLYSVRCKFTLSTSARLSIDFAEGLRAARYLPGFRRRASVRLSILFPCFNHLFDTIPTGIGEEGVDRMENEPIGRAKNFYGALDFSVNTFVITASQAQSVCSTN